MLQAIYTIFFGYSAIIAISMTATKGDWLSKTITGVTYLVTLASFLFARFARTGFDVTQYGVPDFFVMMLNGNWLLFSFGAFIALIWVLQAEGIFQMIWERVHPQSAPTPEAGFSRRAQPTSRAVFGQPKAAPAMTLMGTSSEYLKDNELDMRTETLVKMCFYAFSGNMRGTLPTLQASLNCAYGQREKNFQRLVSSFRGRPNLKRSVHRYWRSINGNAMAARQFFVELCTLAKRSGNVDPATIDRLTKVGHALGLTPQDMGLAISRLR